MCICEIQHVYVGLKDVDLYKVRPDGMYVRCVHMNNRRETELIIVYMLFV